MFKRIVSAVLIAAVFVSLAACSGSDTVTDTDPPTGSETAAQPSDETTGIQDTGTVTDEVTEPVTEPETEGPIIDEDPVFYERPVKERTDVENADFSGADWNSTIVSAAGLANGVQGKYTDGARTAFTISNQKMSLTYHVLQNDVMQVTSLANSKGVPYFKNSMDAYVRLESGEYYRASLSLFSGRVNSQRLGYYYYDFHFRDQGFTSEATKVPYDGSEATVDLIAEYSGKFIGSDIKGLKTADGKTTFTVSSPSDPMIRLEGLQIPSGEFDAVQIKIKSNICDILGLFLCVDGEKVYSPDRQLVHRFDAGEERTIVIPCTLMNDLHGTITGLKLYFSETEKGDEIEITDFRFIKRGGQKMPLLFEHSYHTYPDKVHEQIRVVASSAYTGGGWLGSTIEIPADTVRKFVMKNADGEVSGFVEGFDFGTLEYVGFDVKGAGVFGLIMPKTPNGTVNVELIDGNYVITREIKLSARMTANASSQFFHRIYTSDSHQFNDLRKEAYIERNPLSDIQVTYKDNGGRLSAYDQVRGCYRLSVNGSDFSESYYKTPDYQPKVEFVVTGDGAVDRTIYINVFTSSGALECAALLDQNNAVLPVPMQVSKNFTGEREESRYDPNDNLFAGESYMPVTVKADECKKMTVVHLYQNWGDYPLKQLSSVSFIQPYYHLSIGVSETNCIAPYFVFGKDGWTLPDFRANSAPLWTSQPQHTSIGRLLISQFRTVSKSPLYMSESQSAKIDSAGPVYADMTMDYLSDNGSILATYRHVELPQTDENRTYYELRIKVLKDITIEDFKNNFSIFRFDSRYGNAMYAKISYINENNETITEDVDMKRRRARIVGFGSDSPYVAVYKPNYNVPGSENTGAANFAYIIKNTDITVEGEKYAKGLAFRESCYTNQTHLDLTLDLDTVTLKAGDHIYVDFILLPWGETKSADDGNVRNVRQDSCISPYKITAATGTVIEDSYVPMIRAENGVAEFTFSGGANHGVVRIYGFESYTKPDIKVKIDGEWTEYDVAGPAGYDGYQAYYDEDGTYSFSFIVDMDKADSYEFRVTQ